MNGELLVSQLGQLGLDLNDYVTELGRLEDFAVDAEGDYRRVQGEHEDELARAFLDAQGSVEARKYAARLKCIQTRTDADFSYQALLRAKAKIRTQQASISALHRRIEIGRSMLSREKALMSLDGVGGA